MHGAGSSGRPAFARKALSGSKIRKCFEASFLALGCLCLGGAAHAQDRMTVAQSNSQTDPQTNAIPPPASDATPPPADKPAVADTRGGRQGQPWRTDRFYLETSLYTITSRPILHTTITEIYSRRVEHH